MRDAMMETIFQAVGLYRPFTFAEAARLVPHMIPYEALYQALSWEMQRSQDRRTTLLKIGEQYHWVGQENCRDRRLLSYAVAR